MLPRQPGSNTAHATEEIAVAEGEGAGDQQQERVSQSPCAPGARRRRRSGGVREDSLEGFAQLALLPSGDVTGHFVAPSARLASSGGGGSGSMGSGVSFSLVGRQVLAQNSCYRDTEWGLLRLSMIRFAARPHRRDPVAAAAAGIVEAGTGPPAEEGREAEQAREAEEDGQAEAEAEAEVVSWVQRKGGDLFRLEPADPDDEDTAAVLASDGLDDAGEDGFASLLPSASFEGETLLSGARADAALARFAPLLVGVGAVVNVGRMRVGRLPAGFLGGASAAERWRQQVEEQEEQEEEEEVCEQQEQSGEKEQQEEGQDQLVEVDGAPAALLRAADLGRGGAGGGEDGSGDELW